MERCFWEGLGNMGHLKRGLALLKCRFYVPNHIGGPYKRSSR